MSLKKTLTHTINILKGGYPASGGWRMHSSKKPVAASAAAPLKSMPKPPAPSGKIKIKTPGVKTMKKFSAGKGLVKPKTVKVKNAARGAKATSAKSRTSIRVNVEKPKNISRTKMQTAQAEARTKREPAKKLTSTTVKGMKQTIKTHSQKSTFHAARADKMKAAGAHEAGHPQHAAYQKHAGLAATHSKALAGAHKQLASHIKTSAAPSKKVTISKKSMPKMY